MKRLLLLRHAKSDWSDASLDDFDRPLAPRGIRAADKIAAFLLGRELTPEHCMCSSAERARRTWVRVAGVLPRPVAVEYRDELYLAGLDALKAVIAGAPRSCSRLILVGHEPGIGTLARSLAGDGAAETLEDLERGYPTAGLAVLRFEAEEWPEVVSAKGYLSHFVRPRRLPDRHAAAQDNGEGPRADGITGGNGVVVAPSLHGTATPLVLKGTRESCETLWNSAIASHTHSPALQVTETFFDTTDSRLRRHGFALRVHREGETYRQTVTALQNGAATARESREWTSEIDGLAPQLAKLPSSDVLERIGLILPGELRPIFGAELTRRVKKYRIENGDARNARIEATLEMGRIVCGSESRPISELRLALLEGPPDTLSKEAARLHRVQPMELESVPLAQRGFALACGERPKALKARPQELLPTLSTDAAVEIVMGNCARHMMANHAAVLDGTDIEGIHQMRVALRRMRSALTIFKGVLSPKDLHWLRGEAKSLIKALGAARDWDVFIDELLRPVRKARPDDGDLAILGCAVEKQRQLAYERVRDVLRAPHYLEFVLDLSAWLDGHGWRRDRSQTDLRRPLVEVADAVLRKAHRKVMKRGRTFEELSDEALHELRISLKKLRYCAEFFASLYHGTDARPYLKAMQRLQDDLGHLNDVAVAETRLRGLIGSSNEDDLDSLRAASSIVLGWYSHALAETRPRIAADWHRFAETRTFWGRPTAGDED